MANRLTLQTEFETILGSPYVYFQPPSSHQMRYPCIRYKDSGYHLNRANNGIYKNVKRYEGVVIDPNPDSKIPEAILSHFPMCSLSAGYTSDNLNHFPFTIYY